MNPEDMGQVVHNLAAVTANLKAISSQMASGQGAAGKLLYDSKTADNVTAHAGAGGDTEGDPDAASRSSSRSSRTPTPPPPTCRR